MEGEKEHNKGCKREVERKEGKRKGRESRKEKGKASLFDQRKMQQLT